MASLTIVRSCTRAQPHIGWALLGLALTASYSGGPVTDLQHAAMRSDERRTFLRGVWRGTAGSLTMLLAAGFYPASRAAVRQVLRFELPRRTTIELLQTGLAFSISFGAFNVALERTSVAHAALFESASSIWIVVVQLSARLIGRRANVPPPHVLGVLLGGAGAILTTWDAPHHSSGVGQTVTIAGDVAGIVAGMGAAAYFMVAETLRLTLDPLVLYGLVLAQFAVYCFVASCVYDTSIPELSFDPNRGMLGWLQPQPSRLPTQLYLAVVFDFMGNFGFIAVMKYVPALAVAAVMLLGPITSTLEGMLIGVEQLPGPFTLGGGMIITIGSGMIAMTAQSSSAKVELGQEC